MYSFKERLIFLFGKYTGPTEIAKQIGMTYQGFARIWYDGGLPKARVLINIQKVTGCDLNWLLTGIGEPYLDSAKNNVIFSDTNDTNKDNFNSQINSSIDMNDFVLIPLYDSKTTEDQELEEGNSIFPLAFRKHWLESFICPNAHENLSVMPVKGDSMDGVLNEGNIILINHTQNKPADGLYVLKLDDSLLVKQTQVLPGNKLLLISKNESYKPITIDLKTENISIVGKVEWVGRRI